MAEENKVEDRVSKRCFPACFYSERHHKLFNIPFFITVLCTAPGVILGFVSYLLNPLFAPWYFLFIISYILVALFIDCKYNENLVTNMFFCVHLICVIPLLSI